MKSRLVVFDMDWVISDTQKFHWEVEINILKSYGICTIDPTNTTPITIDRISKNFAWVQPKEWMKQLFNKHNKVKEFDIHQIEDQKSSMLKELYNQDTTQIDFIPWAKNIITKLSESDIKTAVVTASTRECMLTVLKKLWINKQFNKLVSIYDINPKTSKNYISKWEADVYRNIKEELKIDKFIMIEDGRTGMIWAEKAWWTSVAVHWKKIEKSRFPEAKLHIHDLTELTIDNIRTLLI